MNSKGSNRAELLSWLFYDFANSSYSAVIASVVFPVFFVKQLAPTPEVGDVWWGRAVALSMLLVAVTSPFAGGISDLSGHRKRFFLFYTILSILAVTGLSFSEKFGFWWALFFFAVANFFFEGAMVFYNAFLPDIAPAGKIGRVSGWGFGLGYLGSALSLLISIYLVKKEYHSLAFLSVSLFFLIFSLPSFVFLKEPQGMSSLKEAALKGWTKIIRSLGDAFARRDFRLFLLSYFFFRDGINTVIAFSSIFAANTLGFSYEELLYLYLLIQLTAMSGAFLFARPTDLWGPKRVLVLCLLVWSCLCIWTYYVSALQFWFVAATGGIFLGSTQSASRAMFSGFIPYGLEAEYFGLYSFVGKTSSVLGPVIFSTTVAATGSERLAALFIGGLFLAGLVLLLPVRQLREN